MKKLRALRLKIAIPIYRDSLALAPFVKKQKLGICLGIFVHRRIIVSICTNGLGHIHQAIRVLTVLKEKSNFKAAAIVVAKRSKLPAYANVFLEEYGCREIIDLDFELDYEGGGNNGKDNRINNVNIMFMFCYSMLFHGVRIFRTVGNVMQTYRPGVFLSFFDFVILVFRCVLYILVIFIFVMMF